MSESEEDYEYDSYDEGEGDGAAAEVRDYQLSDIVQLCRHWFLKFDAGQASSSSKQREGSPPAPEPRGAVDLVNDIIILINSINPLHPSVPGANYIHTECLICEPSAASGATSGRQKNRRWPHAPTAKSGSSTCPKLSPQCRPK